MHPHDSLTDKLAQSPWPEDIKEVIFILDANNSFERTTLESWIDRHNPIATLPRRVPLLLSDDRLPLNVNRLTTVLRETPDAFVAPLRLSWTSSRDNQHTRPRVVDLIRGGERRPAQWQARRIAKRSPYRVHLLAGKPGSVAELAQRFERKYGHAAMEHAEDFAIFVARQAAVVLDISERKLQGGRYKVPRYVTQSLRSNKEFKARLEQIAQDKGESIGQVNKEVEEYFQEMISIPTSFWLDVWAKFCNFCLGLAYEPDIEYQQKDLERIRGMVRNHPSALLWTHKTYLDGFVIPKIMFENDFPMPHMFGGANLNFPGLGFLLRRAGGIFIKRSFNDNEVYKATLRQYIGYLMEKHFPLTWSFEGTRSRLGKLMPPKYGLLKYVLEGCYNSGAQNIHIIPVTVTYDLIRDAEEYAREQAGHPKAPESLSWLIGYIRSLAQPMGKIYVDFGDPVILPQAPDPNDSLALSKIAFRVAVEANRVTPITFPAVVSMSLLGVYPRALTEQEIAKQIKDLMYFAEVRNLRVSPDFDYDYAVNMDNLLGIMIDGGIISRFDGGPQTVYGISEGQASVASYYRNTIAHYFLNRAIIEVALLAVAEAAETITNPALIFWQEVDELRDLFKFEFFYPASDVFRREIEAELDLIAPDWEALLNQSVGGARKLFFRISPCVAHMTLQMFAEAYCIAGDILADWHGEDIFSENVCVERCMSYGKQAWLQRRVSSEASVGKLLFKTAHKLLTARKLVDASGPDYKSARSRQAQALNTLVRRIEVVRASSISSRGAMTVRDTARGSM